MSNLREGLRVEAVEVARAFPHHVPPFAFATVAGRDVFLPAKHVAGGVLPGRGDLVSFTLRHDAKHGGWYGSGIELVSRSDEWGASS